MATLSLKAEPNKGEIVTVSIGSKEPTPPFWKLGGNMGYNRSRFPAHENLAGTMKSLSKAAHWLFWQLLENRNYKSYESVYTPNTDADKYRVKIAYKELVKGKIAIRIRRGHYLMNPAVVQPKNEDYEEQYLKWCKGMNQK